jgi:hypothetical protein
MPTAVGVGAGLKRGMTFDEYQSGGMALYAEFAEAVAAILEAAIAEQADLRGAVTCRYRMFRLLPTPEVRSWEVT